MKPSRAILILATEFDVAAANEPQHGITATGIPALYLIYAKRLVETLRIYHSIVPDQSIKDRFKEGWMVWNEELNNWTFYEWYWSSRLRTWRPVRFQVVSADGSPDDVTLLSVPDAGIGAARLVSMNLDVLALQGLAEIALRKKKHVMAVQQGFHPFTDFEAFEPLFLEALESAEKTSCHQ
jgi:hypothetical protein